MYYQINDDIPNWGYIPLGASFIVEYCCVSISITIFSERSGLHLKQ